MKSVKQIDQEFQEFARDILRGKLIEFKNDVRNEKAIVLDDDLPDWEADHEDEEGNKHVPVK